MSSEEPYQNKRLFLESRSISITFDEERTDAQVYIKVDEIWIGRCNRFFLYSSPHLRAGAASLLLGKRCVFEVILSSVSTEGRAFIIASVGSESFAIHLRDGATASLMKLSAGRKILIDAQVSGGEILRFGDAVMLN